VEFFAQRAKRRRKSGLAVRHKIFPVIFRGCICDRERYFSVLYMDGFNHDANRVADFQFFNLRGGIGILNFGFGQKAGDAGFKVYKESE
jgi:hypothetical protein